MISLFTKDKEIHLISNLKGSVKPTISWNSECEGQRSTL